MPPNLTFVSPKPKPEPLVSWWLQPVAQDAWYELARTQARRMAETTATPYGKDRTRTIDDEEA